MKLAFWSLAAALVYVYAGYPLLVIVLSWFRRRIVRKSSIEPSVSILIAAYNEAAHIGASIRNKLALDYPPSKLQIIVISDGSNDGTDLIAKQEASDSVLVLRQEPRNGKTSALNLAVEHASGEILIVADANTLYRPDAVRKLVACFADPSVGYVTGKLLYASSTDAMTSAGCSLYMRYENAIRYYETRTGSIVGVNGGIDAFRRHLYKPMRPDQLPDLVLPLQIVEQGFRVIYEPEAIATETALGRPVDEYRMRVRVALRALWALTDRLAILKFWRYGAYSVQVASHKILRYLAFAFAIGLFIFSLALWPAGGVYRLAAFMQILFFLAAGLGALFEHRHHSASRLLLVPYYFALTNCAAFTAVLKFLRGERPQLWKPRLG